MCGIAAVFLAKAKHGEEITEAVIRMTDCQHHRGPDAGGEVSENYGAWAYALGHRRLSIQDLSEAGAQPMHDPETGDFLVFNGEIYNAPALRQRLEEQKPDLVWRGHSDTEVLLQGLIAEGADFLREVEGMYAFVWWRPSAGRLVLGRDPLGIKPLFHSVQTNALVVASEVQAIFASGIVEPEWDPNSVSGYLSYGAVQGPVTTVVGVEAVAPGTVQTLLLEEKGTWRVAGVERIWSFPAVQQGWTEEKAVRAVQEEFSAAVKDHLLSDVPVGIFLSSGLDSTIVAGIAARESSNAISYTVGFREETDHSEVAMAERTAREFGLRHRVVWMDEEDALEAVEPWLRGLDQPCMDGLNTYVIAQAVAAEGLKVALSGQGGDELFGGYPSFSDAPRMERLLRWWSWLPEGGRRWLAQIAGACCPPVTREKMADLFAVGSDVSALARDRRRVLSSEQVGALLGSESGGGGASDAGWGAWSELKSPTGDPIAEVSRIETAYYLGNTLLPVGDSNGMAHGLEIRVPFLAQRMLNLVHQIPGSVRLPDGRANKHLLRRAFPDLLRPEILEQRKRGFVLPLKRWMRGPLRGICEEGLQSLRQSGWVQPAAVHAVWTEFEKMPETPAWSRAWTLVVLGHYARKFNGGAAGKIS